MVYRHKVGAGDPCPLCGEASKGKGDDDALFWAGIVVLGCCYGIAISLLAIGDFPQSIFMTTSFVFGIVIGCWAGGRR